MDYTQAQIEAIFHGRGPALILAVPGAGKTTVLLARLAQLIENEEDPKRMLTITFSKAASLDMKERFQKLFPKLPPPFFLTIHALCFQIIRKFDPQASSYQVLSGPLYSLANDIFRKAYQKNFHRLPNDDQKEAFFQDLGRAKNLQISFEAYSQDDHCQSPNFPSLARDYEREKARHKVIDFDDMMVLALNLLEKESVRKRVQGAFDWIQVDEGQDTSKLQMSVIYKLLKEKNLLIVADDDQSIYAFRGARPQELKDYDRDYRPKKYYLEDNFRSTDHIISLSKDFIAQNKDRFPKSMEGHQALGLPVQVIQTRRAKDQYAFIKDQISPGKKAAILYRNTVSSMGLVNAFAEEDFAIRNREVKFFHHPIILDLLHFMALAENPKDAQAMGTIYYKMKGYLSKKMLTYLGQEGGNVFRAMASTPGLKDFQRQQVYDLQKDFTHLASLEVPEKLYFILEDLDYKAYLDYFHKKWSTSLDQLYLIYDQVIALSKDCRDLAAFQGKVSYLKRKILDAPSKADLTFSTIHGVKGLEFDQVFVLDLVEGSFPSLQSMDQPSLYEEERRLFYVAMTRAKEELYLLSPRQAYSMPTRKSPFLRELEDLI